jgi:hypothetical protein
MMNIAGTRETVIQLAMVKRMSASRARAPGLGNRDLTQNSLAIVSRAEFIVIARPARRAVAIQPFRQAQGPEPVEGLDCFVATGSSQ